MGAGRRRALETELCPCGQLRPTVRTPERKRRRALQTELRLGRVLLLAPWTLHAEPPVDRAGRRGRATVARGSGARQCGGLARRELRPATGGHALAPAGTDLQREVL